MRAAIAIALAVACVLASASVSVSATIYEVDEYAESNCVTVQDKSYYGGGTCVEFHDPSITAQSFRTTVDGSTMTRALYTSNDCSGDSALSVQSTQGTCSGSNKFIGASDQTFLKVNLYSDSACGSLVSGPAFVPLGCHLDKPNKYDLVTATDSSATIASFNASTCTGAAAVNTTTATATFGQCLAYRADTGVNSVIIFGYSNGATFAAPSAGLVLLAAAAALFARNH